MIKAAVAHGLFPFDVMFYRVIYPEIFATEYISPTRIALRGLLVQTLLIRVRVKSLG
jgi:hypothetical protein